jgi:hypothetical protein
MTARLAITTVTASLATLQLIEFFNSANNHCKPMKDYYIIYRVQAARCPYKFFESFSQNTCTKS